jgi:hypothetical protein
MRAFLAVCVLVGSTLTAAGFENGRPVHAEPAGPGWSSQSSGSYFAYSAGLRGPSGRSDKVDGVYYRARITDLDVPFSDGSKGVTPPCGNLSCVTGGNARPQQVLAQFPQQSASQGEFLANGYVAGCAHWTGNKVCTGIHPNGGVYKRWYQDGRICDPSFHCSYWFTGTQLQAVSTGAWHTLQIQRNGNAPGGGFWWRGWFYTGSTWLVNELHRSGHRPQMWYGRASFGAENANIQQVLPLRMAQFDWRNIRYHEFGWPSSNPPGWTNYATPSGWQTWSMPNCSVEPRASDRLEGAGTC